MSYILLEFGLNVSWIFLNLLFINHHLMCLLIKYNLFVYLFLFLPFFSANILAQEEEEKDQEFKLSAEIRPRLEYYHGYKQLAAPEQKHGLSISQRTRLNLDFKNPSYIIRISLQDVRIWGDQEQLVANEDFSASIHEAWGEAIINPRFSIKLGRQEISYEDQRIFGLVDWTQQGRSHDAAILKFKNRKIRAELAIAYNQDGLKLNGTDNVARATNYKAFQNIWLNYKHSENMDISLLFLNNGMQIATGGDAYSQTLGTRINYHDKPVSASLSAYYQGGETANTTKINASYFWLDAAYQLNDAFNAGIGFEHLSGNSQIGFNTRNNAFHPMFGTAHKFNGHMDYFYSGNHFGSVGLNDLFVQLGMKLSKFSIGLDTHYFASAADIEDPDNFGSAMPAFLGLEFDLFFDFKLNPATSVKAGYSQMFASESMEVLKGGSKDETNNWAFLMVSFKPTLFEIKKEIQTD